MRKLVIKKSKKTKVEQGFYVEVSFMIGDADGYTEGKYGPFKDERTCMDFLDMLDSIDDREGFKLPNGKTMRRNTPKCNVYWWNGNFYEAPDEILEIPESKKDFITEELIEAIDFDIPKEPHNENDYLCQFTDYEVYYIDEDGKKLKVEYEENDNSYGDEENQEELCQEGNSDPRTWLPYIEFIADDFSELEIVLKVDGEEEGREIKKEKLQYYKDLKEWKSLITGKLLKIEFVKWRINDDYGRLKENPWRDINDNIIR